MRLTALTLTISLIGSTGCSFAFVDGPPAQHAQMPVFECSSGRVVPILDTIFTVLQVLNLGLAATRTDEEWDDQFGVNGAPIARKPSIGLYAALVALGGAGMYYGFTKTGECRDAKQQLMLRAYGQPQQPGMQPGTWPPPGGAPMGPPAQPAPGPTQY